VLGPTAQSWQPGAATGDRSRSALEAPGPTAQSWQTGLSCLATRYLAEWPRLRKWQGFPTGRRARGSRVRRHTGFPRAAQRRTNAGNRDGDGFQRLAVLKGRVRKRAGRDARPGPPRRNGSALRGRRPNAHKASEGPARPGAAFVCRSFRASPGLRLREARPGLPDQEHPFGRGSRRAPARPIHRPPRGLAEGGKAEEAAGFALLPRPCRIAISSSSYKDPVCVSGFGVSRSGRHYGVE